MLSRAEQRPVEPGHRALVSVFSRRLEKARLISVWLFALVPAVSLAWALWVLADLSGRGLDVTDEGAYLLRAAQPGESVAGISFAGHYMGILYDLAGEDVVAFRMLGILILAAAGALFSVVVVRQGERVLGIRTEWPVRIAAILTLLTACLAYYSLTLFSPSYNWLNYLAILLAATGLLASIGVEGGRGWLVLAGVGVALSLVAKLPSGLALGCAVVVVALLSRAARFADKLGRVGFVMLGFCLVIATHFLLLQGPAEVVRLLGRGFEVIGLLGAHDSGSLIKDFFISLGKLAVKAWEQYEYVYLIIVGALAVSGLALGRWRHRSIFYGLLIAGLGVAGVLHTWQAGDFTAGHWVDHRLMTSVVSMAVMMALTATVLSRVDRVGPAAVDHRHLWLMIFSLLVVPAAFAVGTSNPDAIFYGRQAAGPLFVLLLLPLLFLLARYRMGYLAVLPIAALSLALASRFSTVGDRPYRLVTEMARQSVPVEIGHAGEKVKVDRLSAEAWRRLREHAARAGFTPGTTVIDLTGHSPGLVYGLGGRFVGTPWLLGGYSGSLDFAQYMLDLVPREQIADAWLLISDKGALSENAAGILKRYGQSLPEDYLKVVELTWPYRERAVELWRPFAEDGSRNG